MKRQSVFGVKPGLAEELSPYVQGNLNREAWPKRR